MARMERSEKVVAVHRALAAAGIPHAIGGALALAFYGAPRETTDIDVNVFVPADRRPEVRRALEPFAPDGHPIHVFYSHDALHEEMAKATRLVPFRGTEIPIVSPEHLVVRKAMLDRPKDWLDIEAILVATEPLDLKEIEAWLRRLAGEADPRVTRLHQLIARLVS